MLKKLKYFIVLILVLLIGFAIYGHETVAYFWMQAKGGLNVAFNTRNITDVMTDKSVADSTKKRFEFVEIIKKFGVDSLSLVMPQKNYSTYFEQNGKPLVYVLVVAEKYKLKAKSFDFPVIGAFDYKGFFELEKAKIEEAKYKKAGFDTQINEASAYSTLGYLPEPILSSMLWRSDGSLANLMLHEMTHATIFIKNDHELSENLANFIGDEGAKRFLKSKFGTTSPKYESYEERKIFSQKINNYMALAAQKLDSLYLTFNDKMAVSKKDELKKLLITNIINHEDSLYVGMKHTKFRIFDKKNPPNNAYFAGYLTYHSKQNEMEKIFQQQFKGDFDAFLAYWKAKYKN